MNNLGFLEITEWEPCLCLNEIRIAGF